MARLWRECGSYTLMCIRSHDHHDLLLLLPELTSLPFVFLESNRLQEFSSSGPRFGADFHAGQYCLWVAGGTESERRSPGK